MVSPVQPVFKAWHLPKSRVHQQWPRLCSSLPAAWEHAPYAKVAGGLTKAQYIPKLIHFFQQTSGRMVAFYNCRFPFLGHQLAGALSSLIWGAPSASKPPLDHADVIQHQKPNSNPKISTNINRYQQISTGLMSS